MLGSSHCFKQSDNVGLINDRAGMMFVLNVLLLTNEFELLDIFTLVDLFIAR